MIFYLKQEKHGIQIKDYNNIKLVNQKKQIMNMFFNYNFNYVMVSKNVYNNNYYIQKEILKKI